MCDDELSVEDEIALLRYLTERYHQETDAITGVLKCLIESKFISRKYVLLSDLGSTPASAILDGASRDVTGLITKVAGTEETLKQLIAPIIKKALGVDQPSFGRKHRRPVRPMRSFV